MKKQGHSPNNGISRPAIAGPISRAELNIDEFKAMALARSPRSSTICTTKLCRAATPNPITRPAKNAQQHDLPSADRAAERSAASVKAWIIAATWADENGAAAVPAIRQHARKRRDEHGRNLRGESHQSEKEGGMAQAVCQPDQRDLLHPGADQRNALAEEEQPEVAMGQCPPHRLQPSHVRVVSIIE